MTNEVIHIAIIDDHTLFRQGLVHLLLESEEIQVVFDASDGADMIKKIANHNPLPQVILMDITMPVMDGHASTLWLRKHHPDIKILALSMSDKDTSIMEMLRSGAMGYLLKESKVSEVITAIKTINNQGFYINEYVSGKILNTLQKNDIIEEKGKKLSANELRFLELCSSELTYKEIADRMNVSPHTIDNYRESLFEKFQVRSRTGLVVYAIKNSLIKI
ncbi:response regulator transcription factor [Cytophagaceae bacterium DM2B3-1]|uniref:Response regulator transcription factor n=1 Tax=Xanthocytophaga flava TaxID=3048013 RepID=A0ABT7CFI5_9BACT|nr:response regulator transcription factor [Xanthocytophaga flavus]MDJ1471606.1 response regulator transcription factor [Xanthocytophaga flavus]MDJ1491750.1 response regulator transcription factor [Xanthocytophaga flavus]